ncbi:MAG: GGDEF domain-containing protein [Gemmatimonadota bacterium]
MGFLKSLVRWGFPGGVVAGLSAVVLLAPAEDGGDLARTLVGQYAPIAYGAAAVLAVAFHRSRVLMLVLAVGQVELAARLEVMDPALAPALGAGLAVLLGLGAVARDRGVTSAFGLGQLAFAIGVTGVGVAVARFRPEMLDVFRSVGEPASWFESVTGFPDPVTAGALVGLAMTGLAVVRRRGPVERAAFWSVAMIVASAHPGIEPLASALLRMAAGLTLGLAVLETSYAMAYRDELTGLPARRSLMRDLEGLTGTYTLAMVDVDHFKKFNDRHGHDVGDQVLRLVASRLARVPGGGRAYRYGGEEFTILFRGLDRDEATPHLEAVRASVAAARFSLRGWGRPAQKQAGKARRGQAKGAAAKAKKREARKLSVTVSIGVADSTDRQAQGPEAVLAKADKALYRAKGAGRDRVSR